MQPSPLNPVSTYRLNLSPDGRPELGGNAESWLASAEPRAKTSALRFETLSNARNRASNN